jgi:cytochrome P450
VLKPITSNCVSIDIKTSFMSKSQQLIAANLTPFNLISVANLVAKHPPFSQYPFANMLTTLQQQLERQTNMMLVEDGRLVGYCGWFVTRQEVINLWQQGKCDPTPDWDNPEAVFVNIFVSDDRKAILPILRAASARGDGLPVYRKRIFQNSRAEHKRPPVWARKRKGSIDDAAQRTNQSDLVAQLQPSAQKELAQLLAIIYKMANRNNSKVKLPMRVLDEPILVDKVLRNYKGFKKNYKFLEDFPKGRFSSNDKDWEQRRPLTQSFYGQALDLKTPNNIYQTYLKYIQQGEIKTGQNLYDAFLNGATEVVLRAFGVDDNNSGWNANQANRILKLLQIRQWLSFRPDKMEFEPAVKQALKNELEAFKLTFGETPKGQAFLENMTAAGAGCPHFSASDELAQNMFAATESTASSLFWAVEVLSKNPQWQVQLREGEIDLTVFIQELLRLYSPVPFVTRMADSQEDIKSAGIASFDSNNSPYFIISILGVHTHPDYWQDPMRFNPQRPEFVNETFDKKSFIPFLTGGRACGGQRLAQVELEQGIKVLIDHFEFSQPQGPCQLDYMTTSRPVLSKQFSFRSRA